jgi:hypothetical protein
MRKNRVVFVLLTCSLMDMMFCPLKHMWTLFVLFVIIIMVIDRVDANNGLNILRHAIDINRPFSSSELTSYLN